MLLLLSQHCLFMGGRLLAGAFWRDMPDVASRPAGVRAVREMYLGQVTSALSGSLPGPWDRSRENVCQAPLYLRITASSAARDVERLGGLCPRAARRFWPAHRYIWLAPNMVGVYTYQIAIADPVVQDCTTGSEVTC